MSQTASPAPLRNIASALQVAGQAGPSAAMVVRAAQEAFVDGWQRAKWTGVAAMIVLLAYLAERGPRRRPARTDVG